MENAPSIVLFWFFIVALFVLMVGSIAAALIIHKKAKEENAGKMPFIGKLCLAFGVLCSVPVITVFVYVLYIYIG